MISISPVALGRRWLGMIGVEAARGVGLGLASLVPVLLCLAVAPVVYNSFSLLSLSL